MRAEMKILKKPDDQYRVTLSAAEARIFINCMNETIKELGGWEFQTRMGATEAQIQSIIASIDETLK
jgi:hypothetical protein